MAHSYEWYNNDDEDFVYSMCDDIINARKMAIDVVNNMNRTQSEKNTWIKIIKNTEPVIDKCFILYDGDLDDKEIGVKDED